MNSKIVLKGSISFISLGDLLQQLGGSGSTGTIKLISRYAGEPGYIYMKGGNPINARFQSTQGLEALNAFFGWTEADFEFMDEAVTCEVLIRKSRMEIILDGLRMVDDGIIRKLGPAKAQETSAGGSGAASDLPAIKGPLIDYVYVVDEEEYSAGTDVVVQDKFGNWFWVVLAGSMEVIRSIPEGNAPIVRLSDGAYIGSIVSFLRDGHVRSATVKAISDVQLGVLDSEMIAREYSALSDDFQKILVSFDKRLKQVTDVCARAVLNLPVTTELNKSTDLFISQEQNEYGFSRIIRGEAYVIRQTAEGNFHLCTLTAGDFVGQIPFLNSSHEPYSANVYTSEDFMADDYSLTNVRAEYEALSQTFKNMLQNMSLCISVTTGRILDLMRKPG